MRILFFSELYFPNISGGAEICVQMLAEELVKAGHTVYVCSIADTDNRSTKNGVNLIYLKFHNIYWEYQHRGNALEKAIWHTIDMYNVSFRHDISQIISEVSPDIVHTNNICGFSSVLWTIAKEHHIPLVHTIHDHYLLCYRTTMFNKGKRCRKQCIPCRFASFFSRRESHKVDAVIGVSQYILNKHLENGFFKNATIRKNIPNGVLVREHPEIERENTVIGFMGAIVPFKGVEKLMADFCRLDDHNWTLKLAGNGSDDYISSLKTRYNQNNIQFVGRVDPDSFLSSISLLVVPSLGNEAFGRVIVEAMRNTCPVIVSNRGGMPELVNDIRYIFDPDDPDALFSMLKGFVEGLIGLDPIAFNRQFEMDSVLDAYLHVYNALIL